MIQIFGIPYLKKGASVKGILEPKSWGSAVPPYHGNYINSDPFLEYWFVNRRQNPKYLDLLYDIDRLLNRYRNFKSFDNIEDYTKEETIHDLGYFDEDYYNDLLNKNTEYEVIPRIGTTDFLKGLIYYPKNNRRVLLHEKTHSLWAEPQYNKISEKVGFWNNSNEKYDDNPDEIYSRLMELREYYKLDPNKLYSIEEILKLIQLGKESNWTFNILDRYTPEQILYLINEVAYNSSEDNSKYKSLVAKKGSKIYIKKKNRGKFTEYCGGKVTDECISRAKKSKNPKLRKRAIFALNSRSWSKKQLGGLLKIAKVGTSLENPTKDTSKPVNNRPTPGFIPFTRRIVKKENKKDFKLSNKKDKVMGVKQIGINNKKSV